MIAILIFAALTTAPVANANPAMKAAADNVWACYTPMAVIGAAFDFSPDRDVCHLLSRTDKLTVVSTLLFKRPYAESVPLSVVKIVVAGTDPEASDLFYVPSSELEPFGQCQDSGGYEYDRIEEGPDGTLKRKRYLITHPCEDGRVVQRVQPLN